jgi:hypothetical protein
MGWFELKYSGNYSVAAVEFVRDYGHATIHEINHNMFDDVTGEHTLWLIGDP